MRPTALFLPGTLCDARVWQGSAAALASRLPCRHVDYGLADSIAEMASRALAECAGPLVPIGSSMGGIVALEMMRQAPQRIVALALFGVNPGADTPERHAARLAQLQFAREQGIEALARERLAPAWFAGGDRYQQLAASAVEMVRGMGMARLEAQFQALLTRPDSWPSLPHIQIPVLLVYGQADCICPGELQHAMAELLPRRRLAALEGAGHLAPMEQPVASAVLLADWLSHPPAAAVAPD